jgi:DNA modification methylase
VTAHLIIGDVFDALATLPDKSVDLVVTSPPYWAKMRYSEDMREIGHGDLDDYLADLELVCRELLRILVPTGAMWWNIGDTAAGSGGGGGDLLPGGSREGDLNYRQGRPGLPSRQWCDVPWQFAHMLQANGWLLRSTVVWDKGIRKRESLEHARRPGEQWEPIFLFVPAEANAKRLVYEWDWEAMDDCGNVWPFHPAHHDEHPAVFPPELVTRCLQPFPSARTVLDPFAGTCTTLAVASGRGVDSIGIDLDPRCARLARERVGMFLTVTSIEEAVPA